MAYERSRGVGLLFSTVCLAVLLGAGGALAFYLTFLRDLPDLRSVDDYRPPLASHVLDRSGVPIGEFFVERRILTPFSEVPKHVVDAFVAGEDSSFFEHTGIDVASILRAAWVNLRAGGEIRQGGSTITQQMVKSLLLSPERKLRRKVREMILARRIEERFTKQEILYLYLNQIYFGHGAYGIGEAARTYFGKPVSELSVSEGAQLAGLPKAPSRYSPHVNPAQAEQRRLYVLERMLADGFIDQETHDRAVEDVPKLVETTPAVYADAAFFTEEVRRTLFDALGGDPVLEGGLQIETTVDAGLQTAAANAVRHGLVALDRRRGYRGPLRRVAPEDIATELARLAEENDALPEAVEDPTEAADEGEDGGPSAAGEDGEPGAPSQLAEAEGPAPQLRGEGPWTGIVLEVDTASQRARVGFAPGLEGVVRLEDVRWARKADDNSLPSEVSSIARVFRRGDVARFALLPEATKGDADGDERETPLLVLHQEPLVEGALLSLDVRSGEVLALVGGYDFERSQFNRVTQARRQPGSAFKPFIYGAALAKGYTPASIVFDRPVVYVDETSGFAWRPRNYGRTFYGPITLREALARSINNATVHLFRDVGVDFVIRYARRLGIESELNRDLSLALGSSGLSLLEMTRAYATFPAGGRRVTPTYIRRVLDRDGNVLLENVALGMTPPVQEDAEAEPPESPEPEVVTADAGPEELEGEEEILAAAFGDSSDPDQLLPPSQAYLVTSLLQAVVNDPHGTGGRLRVLGRPVAGKTGTTNDQADAWFMGFSPEITTGVWVGHDEIRFLGVSETGSRAAAPIWIEYMQSALADLPVRDFAVPEDIVFARVDRKTGLLADSTSEETVFQAFLVDTEPSETARSAQTLSDSSRALRMDSF